MKVIIERKIFHNGMETQIRLYRFKEISSSTFDYLFLKGISGNYKRYLKKQNGAAGYIRRDGPFDPERNLTPRNLTPYTKVIYSTGYTTTYFDVLDETMPISDGSLESYLTHENEYVRNFAKGHLE